MDRPVTRNSICQECYERNIETRLVEYKPDPQNFMVCPFCRNIVSKKLMRYVNANIHPLGWKGSGETKFEVLSSSRKRRTRVNRELDGPEVFNVNDYKLPNGEIDKDLVHYASQGFIVSVNDSGNESEQDQY